MTPNTERHINVVTHDAPIAEGPNIYSNVQKGLMAVGNLLARVTGGGYAVCISGHREKVVRLPLTMREDTPPVVVEILATVAQRVFNEVAGGQEEAAVVRQAMDEIDRQFANIPGPADSEE